MTYAHALRPGWTPLTILLMVIGFAIAWPLGLAMVAYILWGNRIPEIRSHFEGMKRDWSADTRCGPRGFRSDRSYSSRSGNAAFDDYRDTELKRLDEERRRLEEERAEFEAYVHDLRRARDKDEFDRFMTDREKRKGAETIDL
jgi:Protein of unknown function (DUF2852)